MDWEQIDWIALDRLRAAFLTGSAGESDYWKNERDLVSYDLTFAQRIGWKWDHVLLELKERGWAPPPGSLLDWGCGSGVAGRIVLDHFGTEGRSLLLWDRSSLAAGFALRRARERFAGLPVRVAEGGEPSDTLILSHVLTELNGAQIEEVIERARRATAVLWVEPGTYDVSRRLIGVRERLRAEFHVVAPCPHQGVCGMLAAENAPHWCHHFASPPPQAFTDGGWARFAQVAGIDLRSLPLSYLVLDKRPIPQLNPGAVRIVGRPRVYKGYALLLGCDSEAMRERQLWKRDLPEQFKKARKGDLESLQAWERAGDRIVRLTKLQTPATDRSIPLGHDDNSSAAHAPTARPAGDHSEPGRP